MFCPCDENSQDWLLNFPVYHTAALAISTMLYITSLILTYLITRNLYLLPPCFNFPSPNYLPLETTNLISFPESGFWGFFLLLDSMYKWDHTISVFLWLISLSIMPSRSIHVVAYGRTSFFITNTPLCVLGMYTYIYKYHDVFIHSSTSGYLGCFNVLAFVHNDPMNIWVQIS